jgi:hypothetical protein
MRVKDENTEGITVDKQRRRATKGIETGTRKFATEDEEIHHSSPHMRMLQENP